MSKTTLVWLRQDLRLSDHPALYEAAGKGKVMLIYILDDETPPLSFKMGGASRWWLHHSLMDLNQRVGGQLNFYRGDPQEIIPRLIEKYSIPAVYWSRCYEPWRIRGDAFLKTSLREKGIECKSFNGSLLWEPHTILKKDQSPYQVFTPFYKRGCLSAPLPRFPLPPPESLILVKDPDSLPLGALGLMPRTPWYESLQNHWSIGEEAASTRLKDFLEGGISNYKEGRNFPAKENVSRLSPYLHFGEISPHQVWTAVHEQTATGKISLMDIEHFLTEIGWREFSYYLLYHFPTLPHENFQRKFDHFSWEKNEDFLVAWQKGQTGYPIIDAGMRQLWQTGYMHNRVRMIVGSFLVKNLRIDWRTGAEWFWDCLVDADLASNSASWQWIAGSGADAAPYFRIFNPVSQGEKFDPQGVYTRSFVPELKNIPSPYLFKPWTAPALVLLASDVILGKTYPHPLVDLESSRSHALSAFANLKKF